MSYAASRTNVEAGQFLRSMAARSVVLGAAGAVLWLVARSIAHDLVEEIRGGLL